MSKCRHPHIEFQIVAEHWLDGQCDPTGVTWTKNTPASIKVRAICPACGFDNRFNAYGQAFVETYKYGTDAWQRWPAWLLAHLRTLAADSPALRAVLTACGIPCAC